MELQRQHILLSYFKTLSAGPVWVSNPPAQQTRDNRPVLYQLSKPGDGGASVQT